MRGRVLVQNVDESRAARSGVVPGAIRPALRLDSPGAVADRDAVTRERTPDA